MDKQNDAVEQNVKPAEQKQPKKKSKVKSVIISILLYILGAGTGFVAAIAILIVLFGMITGFKENKMQSLINQVGLGKTTFITADKLEKIDTLQQTIDYFYYEDVDVQDIEDGMYQGIMAGVGDPYTCYYNAEEYKEMTSDWQGNYEGIGAYLKMDTETGYATIENFIEGGSAKECGKIAVGDYIVAVNGEEVYGMTLSEIVSLIRGPEGTDVTITLMGADGKYDVTLDRRKIDTPTVEVSEKEDGIWYIQITEFDSITRPQFNEALQQAKDADMKGLIIDLRGTPGGNLDVVVDICEQLLPQGLIVYTEDKYGKRVEYTSDGKNEIQVPLVVLIDGNSASASEIMAGAIKDYGIGTLIGTKTYGKGIVQSIIPLGDGTAVKITTSKYFTPKGNNIHKIGIEPDIEVEFDADKYQEDETDNQLEAAIDKIKEQLK